MVYLEDIVHTLLPKLQKMKRMKFNKQSFLVIVFALIFLNFGCHRVRKEVVPDSMVTGRATISADEAILPLLNAEIGVFQSLYNFATIDCEYGSEYDAINLLLQEKTRLALVTRPLNQKEIESFKSRDLNSESIAIGYDAVALIVHPDNVTKALTASQITEILTGKLVNWSQIKNSEKEGKPDSSSILTGSVNSLLHEKPRIKMPNRQIAMRTVFAFDLVRIILYKR